MSEDGRAGGTWLTVIMPSYCGERWIDSALSSIARESAPGIEVIVIDSSPTSVTCDIARGYSDRLLMRILERPDLLSWPHKTNVGVQLAQSSHVCWLHVDDVWLPGRAKAVRSWIEAAPQAPLHLSPSAIIDGNGRRLGVWRCPLPKDRPLAPRCVIDRLLIQNFIAAPSPVFRREAWLECGGLDEALWYTGDWDIWLKLAAKGTVYYHDVVTTGFRIHPQSLTLAAGRDASEIARQLRTVLDRHLLLARECPQRIARAARASVSVNMALAAAAAGDHSDLWRAASSVLRLGPMGMVRFMRDSRILDRVVPRVRARIAGTF